MKRTASAKAQRPENILEAVWGMGMGKNDGDVEVKREVRMVWSSLEVTFALLTGRMQRCFELKDIDLA